MAKKKSNLSNTAYEGKIISSVTHSYKAFGTEHEIEEVIPPYFPSKELLDAVQYARLLNRPLLIRGEPGCGKTKLAQAIAYELYKKSGKNYRDHYFEWHIKSTTKAVDGIYTFDHLARLREIHELSIPLRAGEEQPKAKDKVAFRKFGPLGNAIKTSTKETPSILLIDEIDKADIDFPNDLLLELDQKRFYIEETKENIIAEYAPIIIITSNDEKELPNAFLRRCVFHYIEFPDKDLLLKIVGEKVKATLKEFKANISSKAKGLPTDLQKEIVHVFKGLQELTRSNPAADKIPSTSELLDWLKVIHFSYLKDPSLLVDEKLPAETLLSIEVLFKSLDDQKFAQKNYKSLLNRLNAESES